MFFTSSGVGLADCESAMSDFLSFWICSRVTLFVSGTIILTTPVANTSCRQKKQIHMPQCRLHLWEKCRLQKSANQACFLEPQTLPEPDRLSPVFPVL